MYDSKSIFHHCHVLDVIVQDSFRHIFGQFENLPLLSEIKPPLPKNCLSFEFCKFYNQSTQDFPYSLHRWHFHNHVINQFVFFFLCLFDCITRTQNIIESYFVLLCKSEMLLWILFGQSYPSTVSYCLSNQNASRDIHIECSKQFKRNLHFYVSGSSGPFWAVLKLP